MKILGITSATGVIGAGIADENGVLAESSVSGRNIRSEKLITQVDDVLNKAGLKVSDIDAVAVTIGPGSYSGLRGGLATAKALAMTLKVPLIAVETLHAIAYNFIDLNGTFGVGVNACRDDYNFSLWASDGGKLKRLTGDITVKADKLVKTLNAVRGEFILAADEKLTVVMKGSGVKLAEPKNAVPWAVNVARIGLEKFRKKEFSDHLALVPEYSHKPNIREYKK